MKNGQRIERGREWKDGNRMKGRKEDEKGRRGWNAGKKIKGRERAWKGDGKEEKENRKQKKREGKRMKEGK